MIRSQDGMPTRKIIDTSVAWTNITRKSKNSYRQNASDQNTYEGRRISGIG